MYNKICNLIRRGREWGLGQSGEVHQEMTSSLKHEGWLVGAAQARNEVNRAEGGICIAIFR